MSAPLLALEGLAAGYGAGQVLFDVCLSLQAGEMLALMGRNGMGKTTTVRCLFGLLTPQAGSIRHRGDELCGLAPHMIARRGLGLVPEGRQIFPTLTVEENLKATARPGPWTLARVHGLFPRLAERRRHLGGQISGGEQQMAAIGRALLTNPNLLVLDEATEGLAPLIRDEIWTALDAIRSEGMAIIVIDKSFDVLKTLSDRHVVLERGHVVWSGTRAALQHDLAAVERYLHVG